MHLILGGKYMGKLEYARQLRGGDAIVCDLKDLGLDPDLKLEKMFDAGIVANLQDGVRAMLERGLDARAFFAENILRLEDKVLIGDEIGSGVVPLDPFERRWRDETGFIYQLLARRAKIVDRVWAGLPARIKGPE
jgi:hypothetical protein